MDPCKVDGIELREGGPSFWECMQGMLEKEMHKEGGKVLDAKPGG